MPGLDTRTWALIPLAVSMNWVVGTLVSHLRLPVYLDSLGTILVGGLCGPAAGALTGAVGTLVIGALGNPSWLAFTPVAALVGALAGVAARRGMFAAPWLAAMAGFGVGAVGAVGSALILTAVLGGSSGGGTDLLVAAFRAAGYSRFEAAVAQGLVSDPVDKMCSFLAVQLLLGSLPAAVLGRFPLGAVRVGPGPRRAPRQGLPRDLGEHGERREIRWAASPVWTVEGSGPLHRLNPFTKVLGAALAALVAFTSPVSLRTSEGLALLPTLPLLVIALLGLGVAGGVGVPLGRSVWVAASPLAVSMVALNGLFGPGATPLVGPLLWSRDGAMEGLALALRLTVVLEACFLVLLTTRPGLLVAELERRGLPHRLAYVGLASLQFLPAMARRAGEILDAQTARGLPAGRGLLGRLRGLAPLAGPLVLGALSEVEDRALALEARGFSAGGRRTTLSDPPRTSWDLPLQIVSLALSGLLAWKVWAG